MTNEEVIAIIRNEYKCVDRDCDIERSCGNCNLMMSSKEPILEAYKLAIKALEQQPCEDCISRQAVLDIDFKRIILTTAKPAEMIEQKVKALPLVTPQQKYGKWIIIDDCEKFIAKCSKCGRIEDSRMISKYPYCHCGCRMCGCRILSHRKDTESQEGEDKE